MSTGHATRNAGKAHENGINLMHERYDLDGWCKAVQMGTVCIPVRGRGGNVRWQPVKSYPDYHAVIPVEPVDHSFTPAILPSLRLIEPDAAVAWFDSKYTVKADKFTLAKAAAHQARRLWEFHQYGATCFFLVTCAGASPEPRHWAVWPEPRWSEDRGWTVHLNDQTPREVAVEIPNYDGFIGEYVPDWMALFDGRA